MAEHVSLLRKGVVVVHRSDFATFVVSGPDRASWLNAMLTCDVGKLPVGCSLAGLALDKKGKILSEVLVVALSDRLLLAVDDSVSQALLAHFNHHLIMEDAEICQLPAPRDWFLAYGPEFRPLMADLCAVQDVVGSEIVHFGHKAVVLVAPPQVVPRSISQRRESTDCNVAQITLDHWEQMRIDQGILRFGLEFDSATYPDEAGLDQVAIDFNKGCYLGQEVIAKMRSRGHPSQALVRIVVEGNAPLLRDEPLLVASGESIGIIRSASPSLVFAGQTIAWARVRFVDANVGNRFQVGGRNAVVVPQTGLPT